MLIFVRSPHFRSQIVESEFARRNVSYAKGIEWKRVE